MQNLGNSNFENYIGATEGFSEIAYQFTSHILTLGYAVMLAGLLYFILTIKKVDKRFQMSNILSAVVMVSAFLLLYAQANNWTNSFTFNADSGKYFLNPEGDLFNNGYRYLNWLIDVPMLLFQILFVVSLTKSNFASIRNQFWISGALMIITGYIGQFYEVTNLTAYFIWGAISSIFFFHILWVMHKVIKEGKENISAKGQKILNNIWYLFLISWFLYPGAYLMPYLGGIDGYFYSEDGVMARQLTYTIADVSSKVIYGVLLGNLAITLSSKTKTA